MGGVSLRHRSGRFFDLKGRLDILCGLRVLLGLFGLLAASDSGKGLLLIPHRDFDIGQLGLQPGKPESRNRRTVRPDRLGEKITLSSKGNGNTHNQRNNSKHNLFHLEILLKNSDRAAQA